MKKPISFPIILMISVFLICCKPYSSNKSNEKSQEPQKAEAVMDTLFKKGDKGYNCFRIPAVVPGKNGSILAFAEARKNSCSDTGDIDLVMRKSDDNGKSWGPISVIWDDGNNVCGNPAPVLDETTGNIHLLLTRNLGEDHESEIIAGTSKGTREVFHMVSEDNGETWSNPKNITKAVKLPDWTWYATGPVHGIQKKKEPNKGRLLVACDHIRAESRKMYSHSIYSDDHGMTWQLGGISPNDQVNECAVAELKNGDLVLNMRNYARDSIKGRQVAYSDDGGATWKNQHIMAELPEPVCQGALLDIERGEEHILLFSNPSDSISRVNMTVSLSRDGGRSWNERIPIFEGAAAYSDLAQLSNNEILVVFEAGLENPYEGIFTKRFKVPN
ncbi:sialidase family protein [Flagellimonas myxillae]|uniref:sialidase family protein n=1 Tax=Flagellimonas myxillae TaxID=2942214 RepID=UPI00201F9349|nr:sialidase family protein [Muricauda myxillae]MCL6268068.1 glycoside hydrolase [Muricauda myxillae]